MRSNLQMPVIDDAGDPLGKWESWGDATARSGPSYVSLLSGGLETVAVSELAGVLAGVDRSVLNGHDVVRVIAARQRLVSPVQAELCADVSELCHCPPGGRFVSS